MVKEKYIIVIINVIKISKQHKCLKIIKNNYKVVNKVVKKNYKDMNKN